MALMTSSLKKKVRGDDFDTMGLVVGRRWHMYWGYKHGHLRWAPLWVRGFIIHIWNHAACRISGHSVLDERFYEEEIRPKKPEIVCTNCCKRFTPSEYEAYLIKHPGAV